MRPPAVARRPKPARARTGKLRTKAFIFGTVVGTISCYYGIQVEGGAEGVGRSTTKSVVTSLTSMLATDAVLTALIYFS